MPRAIRWDKIAEAATMTSSLRLAYLPGGEVMLCHDADGYATRKRERPSGINLARQAEQQAAEASSA